MHQQKIVVLGTGGTIAGLSKNTESNINYTSAQVGVSQLVDAVAGLNGRVETEQVAQLDSKDMSFGVWTTLANRVQHHLERGDVRGVVITHGTDTLEETAYFLQAVLNPAKPVVLTCAMRPASALAPDGPFDATTSKTYLTSPAQTRHPTSRSWQSQNHPNPGSDNPTPYSLPAGLRDDMPNRKP